ncbi:choice-of-anchor L domain-containing protein, partial [Lacinutrix mariniflava]|uniref:choice-of-anchor L domain-containing protein n=1 Tax=Lacinutrix mariniflava TaxID=342955 RepID=UPI00128F4130
MKNTLLFSFLFATLFSTVLYADDLETPSNIEVYQKYILPNLPSGNTYYTESGGPDGYGLVIKPGTVIYQSTTLYTYSSVINIEDNCFNEQSFDIIIKDSHLKIKNGIENVASSITEDKVFSPYIDVDITTYSTQELVTDVLINNSCALVADITSSDDMNFGASQGIGSFTAMPGAFAFQSGIILSTGNATAAEGPETGAQNNGTWGGDADLEAIIGGGVVTYNASYIEFSFVPTSNTISFDYIFASEEYGAFQCSYADAFAFILTKQSNLAVSNLAVVPGTTDPVGVTTVRDNAYRPSCTSVNPMFFDSYYGPGGQAPIDNPTNFLGYTVPMTAFANVIAGDAYTIKLVIADGDDSVRDAAVFIGAGTFDLGGGDLGEDITIAAGTAQCQGTSITLDTSFSGVNHTWYLDGNEIFGETGSTLDITQQGNYFVEIDVTSSCQTTDSIFVEYKTTPIIQSVNNLTKCNNGSTTAVFNLTDNNIPAIGTQDTMDVSVTYHISQANANSGANPILNPIMYTGTDGQTIFIRIEDTQTGSCFSTDSFLLQFLGTTINTVPDLVVCDDTSNDGTETFILNTQDSAILGTLSALDYSVTYHDDFSNADAGTNALANSYINTSNPQPIFVRIEDNDDPTCYISSTNPTFNLVVDERAVATQPNNIRICDDSSNDGVEIINLTILESEILNGQDPLNFSVSFYELQTDVATSSNPITNPTVYSNTASPTQTIYVRVDNNSNTDCFSETSFTITIDALPTADDPLDVQACDTFNLPDLTPGNDYYTATGGPTGSGTLVTAGTAITTTTTLFVYKETGTTPNNCTDENSFTITINTSPTAAAPSDVQACDTFTLLALTPGNDYYTATGGSAGTGTLVTAGTAITTTTTLFVFTETGTAPNNCTDENSFTITIDVSPTADAPLDVQACDTYTLPTLTTDNDYYTTTGGPTGTGTLVTAGTAITTTTTLFVYKATGTTPNNCTDENSFTITINTSPTAAAPSDVQACDTFTLLALTPGNDYYTATGGPAGTGTLVTAGTAITTTTTLFVFTETGTAPNNCTDENSFTITIDVSPTADAPLDVQACDTYTLPALTADNEYYTATGGPTGAGTLLTVGTAVTTTTTLFVYKETGTTPNNCTDENSFTITIDASPTADAPSDVQTCDTFTLLDLTPENKYYTATGGPAGTGTLVTAGTAITTTTTLFVFTETGTTPNNCTDENSFTITIDVSPTADAPLDVQACDTYTLPTLTTDNEYYTATGGPTGTGALVTAGTAITTTTTLFVYKETGTTPNNCTDENSFTITIDASPTADAPSDVQACDTFTLLDLTPGNNYYTATGGPAGTGTLVTAGTAITTTTTLFVFTETGTTPNNCTDENSFTITIDVSPTADDPLDVQACDTYTLPALSPGSSYYTATGGPTGSGAIVPAGTILVNSTTLFVYAETSTAPNNCVDENTFDISIGISPTAFPIDNELQCEIDNNGTVLFNLTSNDAVISNGQDNTAVTYYTTLSNAETASFAILNPTSYANVSNPEIIYIRLEDSLTGCYDTTSFEIRVNSSGIINPSPFLTYCDPDSDGFGEFNLNEADIQIAAGDPGFLISYYETLADAENTVNELDSNYNNIVVNNQPIYTRVVNLNNDCINIIILDLIVNPTPQITTAAVLTPLEVCDDNADGFASFNLPTKEPEILNLLDADATNDLDPTLYTITYYTSEANAEAPTNAIATPNAYVNTTVDAQTIWVRVEDNATGCYKTVALDLIVNPLPVLVQPTALNLCDVNNPGDEVEAFNLEDANAEILDGQTGITLTYFSTQAGADTNDGAVEIVSPYSNTSNAQTVYVRATNNVTGCVSTITLDLRVNPLPSPIASPIPLVACDDDNDGFFDMFDLESQSTIIENGEPN